ncbi:SulP family inorganic anion transporter [Geodermatophilus sp. URMC 61]|uniref:SulP family inorganic anion transporter n=1 Tax=Geodermatophilus sp. URMC 61 TaxID=3423411 RepID=UPI00406D1487
MLAGVDPRVGLFSSFVMAVVIAFTGGRPAMITAATGAIALVVAPLVRDHGLEYLLAAVVLGGVFSAGGCAGRPGMRRSSRAAGPAVR